ncbi:iron-siderophore ABC transporter substrate-binding protein [Actinoplanes sp. NBRC 103695]|uniref:iron-siderophore ABC transporter substrate-binding protein n=1 Tax=Actinoplanes sp. NBRC 103695 TaxID=3032202 RepID=UPI00249FEE8A|nr:iron-siderophore ABC transporter substrate-binding protein [Actinoplanes sp. NBRC 103695]GLY98403.1 ABC transporter substrate-binding protein [Actinoplanes sp. NBRC 103695]
MVLTRRAFAATAAALTAMALAACGTTEEPTGPAASPAAPATGPVDLTDERGPVHLDKPAANVVSLEWGLTENLVALGVKPAGQADVKGYNAWNAVMPIDAKTPDVGLRGEPSLDAIVALKPDLVVTTTDVPENVLAQIAKQAPVIALKGSDGAAAIAYMKKTVTTLAKATGTDAQGAKLIAGFDAKITAGKEALAAAGKTGAPFTMSDGWVDSGTVSLRMYTPTSFFGAIGAQLGLQNQWTAGGDKDYGLAQTDVEGLTKITNKDNTFVYVANKADDGEAYVNALQKNKIWTGLPFVQSQKVKRIPDGIWMFGGPASAGAYVDALVAALTE